jgi:hypothetical protein
LAIVAVAIVAVYVVASIVQPRDAGPWILISIFAFFGGLVLLAIFPARIARPYRTRSVDRRRCVWGLRANNPGYTALPIEQVDVSQDRRKPQQPRMSGTETVAGGDTNHKRETTNGRNHKRDITTSLI